MLLLFSCKTGITGEPVPEKKAPLFSRFSIEQTRELEKTFEEIKNLRPGTLKTDATLYKRLTTFKKLFGFSLDGKKLLQWVLKRVNKVTYKNSWTVAVNENKGNFLLGDAFFNRLSMVERLYLLIHEARHSDNGGYKHVRCPENFKFVSAGQPDMKLSGNFGCDDKQDGAYAFQAAFLFELFAYGIFDQKEVGLLYNSSVSRIIH
ncbi:MAG: hypothetical protein ACE5FU_03780 [Nitrospinota bacterium]